jgi:small GTP-binding protein
MCVIGKTTILYRMKRTEDFNTVPTIGFNVETISPCRGLSLTVWDVGGQDHLRTLWHHYFENVDGLVFVIDSTDRGRLYLSKAELKVYINMNQYRMFHLLLLQISKMVMKLYQLML